MDRDMGALVSAVVKDMQWNRLEEEREMRDAQLDMYEIGKEFYHLHCWGARGLPFLSLDEL